MAEHHPEARLPVRTPPKPASTEYAKEAAKRAVKMALMYTDASKRAEAIAFFDKPENKKHAPMIIEARKVVRGGIHPKEQAAWLKERLEQRFH